MVTLVLKGILLLSLLANPRNETPKICTNFLPTRGSENLFFVQCLLTLRAEGNKDLDKNDEPNVYGASGGFCIECCNEGNDGLCTHGIQKTEKNSSDNGDKNNANTRNNQGHLAPNEQHGANEDKPTCNFADIASGNVFVSQDTLQKLAEAGNTAVNDMMKINELIKENFISEGQLLLRKLCETLMEAITILSDAINWYSEKFKQNKLIIKEQSKSGHESTGQFRSLNKELYSESLKLKIRLTNLKLTFSKHCISFMEKQELLLKQTTYGKYMSTQSERKALRDEYTLFFLPSKTGNFKCVKEYDTKHCNSKNRCTECKSLLDKFNSSTYTRKLEKLTKIEREYERNKRTGGITEEQNYCKGVISRMRQYVDDNKKIKESQKGDQGDEQGIPIYSK
ncbi:hypothetical protein FG379_001643, partial [Cryptosporidium bovis]|uniref:uncharacterized protein n=1 Tax=Cryptosporidium bovis TaxID=310047 RepID=UPI00351A7C38